MAPTIPNAPRFPEAGFASPETLGLVMLEADPQAWRLDRSTRLAAVSEALADGTATARNVRTRFPDHAPEQIAGEFRLPIETTDNDPMVGSIWRFAEYRPRPPRIVLYSRGLDPLERALTGVRNEAMAGQRTTQDVLNAEQALVNARQNLLVAQHDRVVASYSLLSAVGRLSPQILALPVSIYDPSVHYQQVRDSWIGVRTPSGQ